ncbi:TetR/AcrR family transcriptional regulator [Streptomyces phaeochromogenes]|uniref:TetR/AcrR family transcriptional regulator n=1 Tax=Streptomyces phaeochromogenes TaxID=1923 RepID=UPI002E0F4A7C|nr:TetR/AcrR family transcriptional regulator [Streptomyces phaeochromogenes]
MNASSGRGPYAKSAEVRRRILEACVDAFGETGFYGATMKGIAKRAGISHTGLLHHFARKEDLLIAVLELRDERSAEFLKSADALDPASNPVEVLRGMLTVVVDNELQPGIMELHCVLSGEATAPGHPAHTYFAERYRSVRRFYTETYTALAERGELRSAVDPATLAVMTLALINGLQAQWLFDRDSVKMESAIQAFLLSAVPGLGR